jgi:hypothetical protein
MGRSLAFYRRLGPDLPPEADSEPHVEVAIPGGLRLAWDTVETIRSVDPDWAPPQGGNRVSLAFRCDSPTEVDRAYDELTGAGYHGYKKPWDAFWGQRDRPLHAQDPGERLRPVSESIQTPTVQLARAQADRVGGRGDGHTAPQPGHDRGHGGIGRLSAS